MITGTEYYGVDKGFCEWNYIQGVIKELNFDSDTQLHVVSMTQEWDYRDKVVLKTNKRNVIIGIDQLMYSLQVTWRQ